MPRKINIPSLIDRKVRKLPDEFLLDDVYRAVLICLKTKRKRLSKKRTDQILQALAEMRGTLAEITIDGRLGFRKVKPKKVYYESTPPHPKRTYFLHRGGFVKVVATCRISKRMSQLSAGGPGKIEIVGFVDGDHVMEMRRTLIASRVGSDWYKPSPTLSEYFCQQGISWQDPTTSSGADMFDSPDDDLKIFAVPPGPWVHLKLKGVRDAYEIGIPPKDGAPPQLLAQAIGENIAAFICSARTRWPAAIQEIIRLRAEIKALKNGVE